MSENIAIELKGVSKSFGKLNIISSLNMQVREQEFISILGPSGCGKTTILKLIAGLEDIDEGSVYINDNLVSEKILPSFIKKTLSEKENFRLVVSYQNSRYLLLSKYQINHFAKLQTQFGIQASKRFIQKNSLRFRS